MKPIQFANADISVSIKNKKLISQLVAAIFNKEKRMLNRLQYIFCSDEFLLTINQQYLHHEDYTDIISFDLGIPGEPVVGEIYISYPRVKENAAIYNVNIETELIRVIAHGALHLCGYKDKTKSQKIQMRQKEEQYLRIYKKLVYV